ncbi:MAG: two-component sensor histidine kinase, partial [Burkholderiales bacterium PBB5]
LAVAQREAPADLQPRLQRARDAAERLRRVVTALLSLFRAGADVQRRPVDLPALLAHLPVEPLQVHCEVHQPLWADADLLAAALANLLDNAVRHGARTVTLRLHSGARGDPRCDPRCDWLELHDDGRGLAGAQALQMQALLDARRYERPVGLGLMLADLVARAHGSRLQLLPVATGFAVALGLGHAPEALQRSPGAAD